MKILLTSSGIDRAVYAKIRRLLGNRADISVGFLKSSIKYMNNQPALENRLSEISNNLLSLGFKKADGYYLPKYTAGHLAVALDKYDVIYICGGNTFNLLNVIKIAGFEKVLDDLKDKKIIVSESAGSYVLCPNIEMANWKGSNSNEVGIDDLTGLNYVPFLVSAHYSDEVAGKIKVGAKKSGLTTYALRDGQAVFYQDGNLEYLGGEPKVIKA